MTLREKAVFIADYCNFQGYLREGVIDYIFSALAVIEGEELANGDGCKAAIEEEREAILSEIAKQREEYKKLALDWARESALMNANPVAKIYAHSVTVCEVLEKRIRDRSANPP